VTYRAELSGRVLAQLGDFPAKAFDALITAMSVVVEYPDDPLRTFPTSDPYVRRAACRDRFAVAPGELLSMCCNRAFRAIW
jgi:hypothetical protein